MRSILVHADNSPARAARLATALAIARANGGHVTMLINTPFQRFVAMDPFGGAYLAAEALASAQVEDEGLRTRLEADLANEDVPFDVTTSDVDLTDAMASAARLADIAIVSMDAADSDRRDAPALLAGGLAVAARVPVLALPCSAGSLSFDGTAMVAWDGSHESANALRAAVPLLRHFARVQLVTIAEKTGEFPQTEAMRYLSRHGISAEMQAWDRGNDSIEEALDKAAGAMNAALIVMGAYGHSRLRETIFGGVTRYFIDAAKYPLLLAH